MIPFKIEKLEVKHMYIKMVSSALGGMITIVDENKTKNAGGKESFKKIKIPHQLARDWKKRYTVTKYIKPVLSAVTFYGDHVVALERHPLGNLGKQKSQGLFGEVDWISDSEHNLDTIIVPLDRMNDFYFDGTFLYTITDENIQQAQALTRDSRFKSVKIKAYKLSNLPQKDKLHAEERTCLAYTPSGRKTFMTPPIWKTMSNIGVNQMRRRKKKDIEDEDNEDYRWGSLTNENFVFDNVDVNLSVNLGFALKAGRELSEVFGYDVIEPLGFDDLMIQMRTVNLPNIANEVKQTYDTGLPFTHAVAWMIGLVNRTKTLESFLTLRSLLKHLTTKGVYRKNAFDTTSIFKDPNVVDVPLKTLAEAAKTDTIDTDTGLQMARIARKNAAATDDGDIV